MKPLDRPAIAVRLKRIGLGLALAGLGLAGGCGHHKRTALRPVYVAPAPIVAPAPAATECPTTDATPALSAPGDLGTSPPSSPAASGLPKTDRVVPQSGSSTEPGLIYPNSTDPKAPTSGESPPPLTRSGAGRSANRRPAVGSPRQADGVKDRVSGFIQEPDDLFLPPKADRAWRYIVLHHSDHAAGSYAQIDRDHRERLGTQGCGYHFVIGNGSESPDGRVEIASRWLNQKGGAHCRDATVPDANDYGIGVCLIGDLDDSAPTRRQVDATRALVAYLQERYDIPADRVVTHASIAQTATTCPGSKFPVDAVLSGRGFAVR